MNVREQDFNSQRPTPFISPVTSWVGRLYRALVLQSLGRLQRGSLTLQFPDGSAQRFGDSSGVSKTENSFPLPAAIHLRRPEEFFRKLVWFGHVGLAEAYMAGDWDTPDITAVISWGLLNQEEATLLEGGRTPQSFSLNILGLLNQLSHKLRPNNLRVGRRNIQEHYDLGNDFFQVFLDETMTYSCARFSSPEQSLAEAQLAKIDRLCQKLRLQPDDEVLEIGSGWGALAMRAARAYGCRVRTITLSEEQRRYVTEKVAEQGLSERVSVELIDYRHVQGRFDKIVSVEMLEAVGDAYLDVFFSRCAHLLKPRGLLGLQVIACPDARYALLRDHVDFIQKHIFPGSLLPSIGRLQQATQRTGDLFLHELEDMGDHYPLTLARWRDAFNDRKEALRTMGFDEAFIRKWNYYFQYCRAAFQMRNITVFQAIYTRPNNLLLSGNP